jgi:hypothetical protein
MGEVLRSLRYLNLAVGMAITALVAAAGGGAAYTAAVVLAGVFTAVMSIPGRGVRERYGAWQNLIR